MAGKGAYFGLFDRPFIRGVFQIATRPDSLIIVDQSCQADEGNMTRLSAGLKLKLFMGCNMSPRLQPKRTHFQVQAYIQEVPMTQSQRLKYSILISLVVLGIMFGLSYLQNTGVISEKLFQYIAIGVAVVVVVINGVMRRKVKP